MNFSDLKLSLTTLFGLMCVILMMILPLPSIVLDFGLALSFALSIMIFTVVVFVRSPLQFSSFPSILVVTLILRLALNISSTKLIIGEGHTGTDAAGQVIEGFALFIMGGNIFLGLIIFCLFLIVNFTVITKGATRMAEVSARFALDGMPGKQLAIDSDMSAGAIDHNQARIRRETEQAETTFLGSLDGASKFVKGDAVAGLLIVLLNLVAGLAIGIFEHGMPTALAFETYAILTVGDGLVSQIPAVIVSISAALLLTRGSSSDTANNAVLEQLKEQPAAMISVSILLFVFALVPGFPFVPFASGSALILFCTWLLSRKSTQIDEEEALSNVDLTTDVAPMRIGDILDIDDLHVEFSSELVSLALDPGLGLDSRISSMRKFVASDYGIILPDIRLTDDPVLEPGAYRIRVQGVECAHGLLKPDCVLVLKEDGLAFLPDGFDTFEPVYNAPARWIGKDHLEALSISGATVVSPIEVIATHLLEVIKANLSRLLTLKSLQRILDELTTVSDPARAAANLKLLDDLIPEKVPMDTLQAVLQLLLEEQVSIRNLPLILETVAKARVLNMRAEAICEVVRQKLGFQILSHLKRDDGSIPLVQLAPEWESTFQNFQVEGDKGIDVALPPAVFNQLADSLSLKMKELASTEGTVALATNARRRRFLKTLAKAKGIDSPVLSFEEIGIDARPTLVGVIAA